MIKRKLYTKFDDCRVYSSRDLHGNAHRVLIYYRYYICFDFKDPFMN